MVTGRLVRLVLASALGLSIWPSAAFSQGKAAQAPSAEGATIIQVRGRDGAVLPEGVRELVRRVGNIREVEGFLEGKTPDGVRVIGVEPRPLLHFRIGSEAVTAAIAQGRALETGDAPEAVVVGQTFAQKNKTALGLSIPSMLTTDHFPPIIVGGQGFAIVGIYATGDPKADDQVPMLLATAQKLLNQAGRLSGLYVTPAAPAAGDQVASELRRTLGRTADVAVLPRRQR